jgi:peptidoglycan/xylan/chitin deacetylase (PgdA/CDA1 family)
MTPSPAFPSGCNAALSLTFDVDAETGVLMAKPSGWRDAMAMTHQAFGPKVGVPRILRILAEEKVRATFFVPGWTARRYPHLIATILEDGHEVGHHSDLHYPPPTMHPDEERRDFERALRTLRDQGVEVVGHRAAWWQASWHTLDLLAEHGFQYDSSLMDDDRPYVLRLGDHRLAELPPHWSLDDWEQYAFLPDPNIGATIELPSKVLELWKVELDAQRREGGLVVGTMHPFLSGRASRAEVVREIIDYARACGDVWIASLGEIATSALSAPGVDEREPDIPDLSLGPYVDDEPPPEDPHAH